jgi:arsenite methyltransferase
MTGHANADVKQAVRDRYARAAEGSGCCEPTCCGSEPETELKPDEISRTIGYSEEELAHVPEDSNLGLGCGNPTAIASLTPGQTVLDLGSGAGIDCFLAAAQVGSECRVIGVDMTHEMIDKARANAENGSYDNVEFRLGEIEALPVADATVDVVVSDMVSEVPVPTVLAGNVEAVAACLPTFREQYLQQLRDAGFADVRITSEKAYPTSFILGDPGVQEYIAGHPGHGVELNEFAGSISGAHFEATKA